jgi:hypothetical protein
LTGATHASIGAALGALIKNPALAFAAGVLSHVVADAVPHRDLSPKAEAVLLAATMGLIAARHGLGSSRFWGAVGAVAPDFEHVLLEFGLIRIEDEVFPTHSDLGKWHGRVTDERISQIITFIAGMLVAEGIAD